MSDEKKRPACLGKNCREMIEEKIRPRAQKKICTQEATKKRRRQGLQKCAQWQTWRRILRRTKDSF